METEEPTADASSPNEARASATPRGEAFTDEALAVDGRSPEERERVLAQRRAAQRKRERVAGDAPMGADATRDAQIGRAQAHVAARAFTALAENVRDYAIFLLDERGVITFWGEGARLIKGWSKDEAEGAHLRLLYPPGGSEDGTAEAHLRTAAEHGEYTGEGNRVRGDGSTFWAGVTLTALWDDSGTLLGFAKVTRDLTARRAADALLQAAAESAEAARADAVTASAAKSGFLATMSHEIRTPVNAILGYHELLDLEVGGPLTVEQRRYLSRAGASARHLLALITEVLDFSRIEADHVTVARAVFRVGDAVASALALVGPQAHERGLELVDSVSGYAANLAAWGDEGRVRQILVNLLANAVKFTTGRGGEPGRVTVSAGTATQAAPDAALTGDGPWVYVRVEDTGSGIPADRLQPIFEAFVQADMTLTRQHGGTGLGLAISRRLARLMGGEVTVHSELGVGSTFILWLPAAPIESLDLGGHGGHGTHGPGTEAPQGAATDEPARMVVRATVAGTGAARDRTLRAVADAVLTDLERVLHAYVARLRADDRIPSARHDSEAELEDHLASFLADIAATLYRLDATPDGLVGAELADGRDGTAVQRLVAERHAAQRARLGWHEDEIVREFEILREELAAAVRRATASPRTDEARANEASRAQALVSAFVDAAQRLSLEAFRRARAEGPSTGQ